jgi:Na+/proline symporter
MIHSTAAAVVFLYVVGLFVVTWWAQRLPQGGGGMIGYLLAGRQVPTSVTAAMLTGLAVGGASVSPSRPTRAGSPPGGTTRRGPPAPS